MKLHHRSTSSDPIGLAPLGSRSRLDEEDSDDDARPSSGAVPASDKPWLKEFNLYLDGEDELEEGQSVVSWWGVCTIILNFC